MNDIVLNGETLEISRVIDSIEIEGFDHTFADGKAESKLVVAPGGSEPGPEPEYPEVNIKTVFPSVQFPVPSINVSATEYVENYIVTTKYRQDGFAPATTLGIIFDGVQAGDIILLFVSYRSTFTRPSGFTEIKNSGNIGGTGGADNQWNAILFKEYDTDITTQFTVELSQSSNSRFGYYAIQLRGCTVVNDTSCDMSPSSYGAGPFTLTCNNFSNFFLFYCCVYSGGNPIPNNQLDWRTTDCDSSIEHRMKVFYNNLIDPETTYSLSNTGQYWNVLGVRLEGRGD